MSQIWRLVVPLPLHCCIGRLPPHDAAQNVCGFGLLQHWASKARWTASLNHFKCRCEIWSDMCEFVHWLGDQFESRKVNYKLLTISFGQIPFQGAFVSDAIWEFRTDLSLDQVRSLLMKAGEELGNFQVMYQTVAPAVQFTGQRYWGI